MADIMDEMAVKKRHGRHTSRSRNPIVAPRGLEWIVADSICPSPDAISSRRVPAKRLISGPNQRFLKHEFTFFRPASDQRMNPELDNLCVNTLRFLAVDAVQKADSGHPRACLVSFTSSSPSGEPWASNVSCLCGDP